MMTVSETTVEEIFNHSYLFDEYGLETKSDLVPMVNPDKEKYLKLEEARVLECIGLFNGTEMVGFAVMYISPMLHYSEVAATMESVFIAKEHRGMNSSKRLFEFVEEVAIDRGCSNLFISAPIDGALAKVSKSLGFTATNITFSKEL